MCLIPAGSLRTGAAWSGWKSVKKGWKFQPSPWGPSSCVTLDMVHSLSELQCPHTSHEGGLDELEALSCPGFYRSNWLPSCVQNRVPVTGMDR